jgi:hypothetical protein
MLRFLTLALIGISTSLCVDRFALDSSVPVLMRATELQAIRGGANCSTPYTDSGPNPCSACNDIGNGLYEDCDNSPPNAACTGFTPGQCVWCSLAPTPCEGMSNQYTGADCQSGYVDSGEW